MQSKWKIQKKIITIIHKSSKLISICIDKSFVANYYYVKTTKTQANEYKIFKILHLILIYLYKKTSFYQTNLSALI